MGSRDDGGLARLLGDAAWIEAFGRMLLRSVRLADSLDQGRWGVTADKGRVHLNVGAVQTLTAHSDELVMNVRGEEPPEPGLRGVSVHTISPYKSLSRIDVSHLIVVATKRTAGRGGQVDRITTTIQREWLAEIIAKKKRVEYRPMKTSLPARAGPRTTLEAGI